MKNLYIFTAAVWLLCYTAAFAESPSSAINWSLMTSGMWEENKTLHNRLDLRLNFPAPDLTLRGQLLDRRPFIFDIPNFDLHSPWEDMEKAVTHYQGALYHNKTGSRLLYGALDEWGLSARLRNPWIRSPPYAENHKPLIADLKTAASSTKEDEVYLYLSTPFFDLSPNTRARGFISAQTEITADTSANTPEYRQSAASAGLDFALPNKSTFLFETFYTWATLPPTKNSTWFSNPPPLPQRDFNLYAAGLLYSGQSLSVSSDFALSETFAWGRDFYANFGISIFMPVPKLRIWDAGRIAKPLAVSFAADWAGNRFVYRDGADHGEAFRAAAKIELKGARSALLRFSTTLRAPELPFTDGGETWDRGFTRSSTNFYYRLSAAKADKKLIKLTRVSISADRNADNLQKITDRLYGYIGFSLNLGTKTPVGVVLNGSIRGIASSENKVFPYPVTAKPYAFEDCAFYSEFTFSPSIYQFKTRIGYSNDAKNRGIWNFSAGGAVRFKQGRLSLKIASEEFPNLWNFTISWRLEAN